MRTLIPLDAMGKIEKFAGVFDLDVYRKHSLRYKCYFIANTKKIGFAKDIADYCRVHGYTMPPAAVARPYIFLRRCASRLKRLLKS